MPRFWACLISTAVAVGCRPRPTEESSVAAARVEAAQSTQWEDEGYCTGYHLRLANRYSADEFESHRRFANERLAAGWAMMKRVEQHEAAGSRTTWSKILDAAVPIRSLGRAASSHKERYVDLQKTLFPAFIIESKGILEQKDVERASQLLSSVRSGSEDPWVDAVGRFLEGSGLRSLSMREGFILLAPYFDNDPFRTLGALAWVAHKDVDIADNRGVSRSEGVKATKYFRPILSGETDREGQIYHFWGHVVRAFVMGFRGKALSAASSVYYEWNDPVDFVTDSYARSFATGLSRSLTFAPGQSRGWVSTQYYQRGCDRNALALPEVAATAARYHCQLTPAHASALRQGQPPVRSDSARRFVHLKGTNEDLLAQTCANYATLSLTEVVLVQGRYERANRATWVLHDNEIDFAIAKGEVR